MGTKKAGAIRPSFYFCAFWTAFSFGFQHDGLPIAHNRFGNLNAKAYSYIGFRFNDEGFMARVRLNGEATQALALKTTKVDIALQTRAVDPSRNVKNMGMITTIPREVLSNLLHDYQLMKSELKRLGVKGKHAAHYSESAAFQAKMNKGITEKDVPAFLRSNKTGNDVGTSKRKKPSHQ